MAVPKDHIEKNLNILLLDVTSNGSSLLSSKLEKIISFLNNLQQLIQEPSQKEPSKLASLCASIRKYDSCHPNKFRDIACALAEIRAGSKSLQSIDKITESMHKDFFNVIGNIKKELKLEIIKDPGLIDKYKRLLQVIRQKLTRCMSKFVVQTVELNSIIENLKKGHSSLESALEVLHISRNIRNTVEVIPQAIIAFIEQVEIILEDPVKELTSEVTMPARSRLSLPQHHTVMKTDKEKQTELALKRKDQELAKALQAKEEAEKVACRATAQAEERIKKVTEDVIQEKAVLRRRSAETDASMGQKFVPVQKQLEEARRQLREVNEKNKVYECTSQQLQERLKAAEATTKDQEHTKQQLQEQLISIKEEYELKIGKINSVQTDAAQQYEQQITRLQEQIELAHKETNFKKTSALAAEVERVKHEYEGRMAALESEKQRLESENGALLQQLAKRDEEALQLRAQVEALQEKQSKHEQRIAEILAQARVHNTQEILQLKEESQKADLDKLRQIAELQETIQELHRSRAAIEQRLTERSGMEHILRESMSWTEAALERANARIAELGRALTTQTEKTEEQRESAMEWMERAMEYEDKIALLNAKVRSYEEQEQEALEVRLLQLHHRAIPQESTEGERNEQPIPPPTSSPLNVRQLIAFTRAGTAQLVHSSEQEDKRMKTSLKL